MAKVMDDKNINYHTTNYCNKIGKDTLSNILEKHYKERIEIINSLNKLLSFKKINGDNIIYPNLDYINNFGKYFYLGNSSDVNDCLCNMPKKKDKNNIYIEKDFGKGKVGVARLINIKENDDLNLFILKSISNITKIEYLSLRIKPLFDDEYLYVSHTEPSIMYNKHRATDKSHKIFNNQIIVAGGDIFANQTSIHLILNQILKKNIINYVYQYDAFYCKNKSQFDGYNIVDIANRSDVSTYIEYLVANKRQNEIDDNFIINILKQILLPLGVLKCKKFGFSHSDLKCRNVFVSEVNNIPTYKLADFDKSSIYWKGIRFYNNKFDKLIAIAGYRGFEIKLDKKYGEFYVIPDYIISSQNILYIMSYWIPMHNSFDIYTFILSIIREPIIWNLMKKDININSDNISFNQNIQFDKFWKILQKLFKDPQIFSKIIVENNNQVDKYLNIDIKINELLKLIGDKYNITLNQTQLKLLKDMTDERFNKFINLKVDSNLHNNFANIFGRQILLDHSSDLKILLDAYLKAHSGSIYKSHTHITELHNYFKEKTNILANLRSITQITIFYSKNKIKLFKYIDEVYEYVNIKSPNYYNAEIDELNKSRQKKDYIYYLTSPSILDTESHICISECLNNKCKTNKYSTKIGIYDYGKC